MNNDTDALLFKLRSDAVMLRNENALLQDRVVLLEKYLQQNNLPLPSDETRLSPIPGSVANDVNRLRLQRHWSLAELRDQSGIQPNRLWDFIYKRGWLHESEIRSLESVFEIAAGGWVRRIQGERKVLS